MSQSVTPSPERAARNPFADHVAHYLTLTPRQLPSQYLYDELGSVLFEAICLLPWYRITRVERELLRRHAHDIFTRLDGLTTVVELGPGNGEKISALLEAGAPSAMTVHLIDVSPHALDGAMRALHHTTHTVVPHGATYEAGLAEVANARTGAGRMLALFLGSNIGNFDQPGADAFLAGVRARLTEGDALLLGADLVKPERELLLAYDDPLGVTAAFNRNLLVRVNHELGADFDIDGFSHRAVWNQDASRIEMHLVSVRPQTVRVPQADLEIAFKTGETIWTESSYKYRPADVIAMLDRAGFSALDQWVGSNVALTLVVAA